MATGLLLVYVAQSPNVNLLQITGQPNSRRNTEPKFAYYLVLRREDISYVDWIVDTPVEGFKLFFLEQYRVADDFETGCRKVE